MKLVSIEEVLAMGKQVVRVLALLVVLSPMLGAALPVAAADSPMLHNSNRFPGTTKHGGAWGLPGTKYGEFDCSTCHAKNTGNIKRVKKVITAPNGVDQFPIEADPTPPIGGIDFQDAREGSSGFGDDARADKSQSNAICEACHTYDAAQLVGVQFHGYDMTVGGNPGHYNKADCIACHQHSQGFKPLACDSCHGYPPTTAGAGGPTGLANNPYDTGSTTAGAHAAHAVTLGYACTNCHDSYTMPQASVLNTGKGIVSIGFNNFGSVTGTYSGQATASYSLNGGAEAFGSGTQTCATVYCHSTGQSADGTSAIPSYASPAWSTPASGACGTCHNDTDPATGGHTKHIADGATCDTCHVGNTHVNRVIDVTTGAYTAGGAPGNNYGTCSTASCHDPGRGALVVTPTWGASVTDCSECHASAPATGGHTVHLAASIAGTAIACTDCHDAATDPSTETAPGSGHRDTNIDVTAGSYPADKAKNSAFTNCTTATCHQTGQAANDYKVTSNWDIDDANCTQCHDASPTTGSHAKHIATTSDCVTCHTGALIDTSYVSAQHGDLNVDVAVGGYTADKALGAAFESCASISCHSDGLTAATGDSPVWGTASGCAACHEETMTTGSHTAHLADGATCNNCHLDAVEGTTAPTGIHADGVVNVYNSVTLDLGYPDAVAYGSATWTTCTTASCHDDGRAPNVTAAWGTTVNNCAECHATIPATGSHASHVADAAVSCTDCHTGAVEGTTAPTAGHRDNNIDVTAGGYPTDRAKGSAFTNCTTASCHNDGRNSGVTQDWGTTLNNCSECHATQPATGSHTTHLALYACATCHTGVTEGTTAGAGHRDGDIDVAAATGLATDKTLGSAFVSCATNNCHGSNSPVWGTDLSANDACTQCHGQLVAGPATDAQKAPGGSGVDTNGDSLATDAQVGAHQVHLNPSLSAPIACSACHVVPATITAAGHIDSALPAELTWSGLALGGLDGQSAVTPAGCATTYCHDGSAIKNGWNGGTLAPVWTNTGFIQGNVSDCDNCHGYPPPAAHPANADCSVCHDVLLADDVTFTAAGKLTHVDGIVQASGGDSCTDCHNADIDGVLNGSHAAHTDTATFLAGKTISGGNYGGAGWYTTTYVSGKPNFGCGECHPAAEGTGHPVNGLNLDLDPAGETPTAGSLKLLNTDSPANPTFATRSSVTCDNVYCHSDAAATRTYATTPNWYGGAVSGNCNDCHGNAPATGTHDIHAVGIHYDTLYATSGTGLMATSGTSGSGAAHGDSATSNTINCQTCHNDTVTVAYNAANSVCSSCHSDTNAPATGNERAVISTTGSAHVNGQPNVVFASLTNFKAKSQLRDDITAVTELNNNWTRTNGYKAAANSFDQAKAAVPGYAAGSCSNIACHNGINTPTWSTGFAGDCRACHTSLPQ